MKKRTTEYIVAGFSAFVVAAAALITFNGFDAEDLHGNAPAQSAPSAPQGRSVPAPLPGVATEKLFAPTVSLSEENVPAHNDLSAQPARVPAPVVPRAVPAGGNEAQPAAVPAPRLSATPAKAPRPAQKNFSCVGQICIDADTGEVLSARNAHVSHPPASVTKLMTIYLVLDAVRAGKISLSSPVVASRRAQDTGGTQVHLAAGETNSVEDLLYALMLQSANDAAVALAEKVCGNVEDFVEEMNRKARELGLNETRFSSPHGLPVSQKERSAGRKNDMSSAADLAQLSRALIREHPEVFRYTSAKTKMFRAGRIGIEPLPMGNHNTLLRLFPGCDGLKTGWTNAGASIVTTASRGNRRVIAVVLGGLVRNAQGDIDPKTSQRERNQRAAELMFSGLEKIDALKYEPTPRQF